MSRSRSGSQSDFGFSHESPRRQIRPRGGSTLFVGLLPEEDAAAQAYDVAGRLIAEHGVSVRRIRKNGLHVTLKGIEWYPSLPEEIVFRVSEALCRVDVPAFDVMFDRVATFRHRDPPHPTVLFSRNGQPRLLSLQRQVCDALDGLGLGRKETFNPHMTLLYDGLVVADRPLATPVCWRTRGFYLIHSLVGRSRYEICGTWPLPG